MAPFVEFFEKRSDPIHHLRLISFWIQARVTYRHLKPRPLHYTMEEQFEQQVPRTPVPPYEVWPVTPKGPLEAHMQNDKMNAMDLDNVINPVDRHSRATSALSMDDIEAAQALEGLRAGSH